MCCKGHLGRIHLKGHDDGQLMGQMQSSPAERLRQRLSKSGAMSVADYMSWCMTDGERAYYRHGNPIGAAGDFVTAPEVSQIFGELIAIWAIQVWQSMGAPSPFVLAELGPGRGTLMQDALRAARTAPDFQSAARVHLVETSSTLRDVQSRTLASYCKPQWHHTFGAIPPGPLIIVANEFFDALPVEQHVFENGGWRRRMIALDEYGQPSFQGGRLAVPPAEILPAREPVEGDILEHRPAAHALIRELGQRAEHEPVALLIADYGYRNRDYGDTLQAVHEHNYAHALSKPGAADLSAHVNFAELEHAAETADLKSRGPIEQGEFLLSLGMEHRLRQLMTNATPDQRSTLFLGARRLIDPFQMGSLFKVMAITSPLLPPPPPFKDEAHLPIAEAAPYFGKDMGSGAQ